MPDGGIVYDSHLFRFFYLDKAQTQEFLSKEKNYKILTPKVFNPFWLCFFDLTYKCNLRCRHCHNAYDKVKELSYKQKLNVLDQIFDLGVLHISFGGGEPTLYKRLFDILKYTSKHTTCSFVTNGTLINEKFCHKLNGLVSYVGVSLDGFRETHAKMRNADIFNKAVDSIKLLLKHKIPVRVTTTPTKINFRELPELGKFILNDLRATAWKIMRYIPEGERGLDLVLSDKEERWLYKQTTRLGQDKTDYYFCINCPAGKSVFSIYANGDVSPCGFAPFLISGNVIRSPLIKILRDGMFFKFMRIVKSNRCTLTDYWRDRGEFNYNVSL